MATLPNKVNPKDKIKASVFNQLIDYVRSITPRGDRSTIQVRTAPQGTTISRIGSRGFGRTSSTGDACNGYFKVVKDGDNYNVVDGANPGAADCGYVKAGNSRLPVARASFAAADIASTGAFYIETTYTTSYQIAIKFADPLPTGEDGKDICLIADLSSGEILQRLYNEHTIVRWV